jgi:hypothetical protein
MYQERVYMKSSSTIYTLYSYFLFSLLHGVKMSMAVLTLSRRYRRGGGGQ